MFVERNFKLLSKSFSFYYIGPCRFLALLIRILLKPTLDHIWHETSTVGSKKFANYLIKTLQKWRVCLYQKLRLPILEVLFRYRDKISIIIAFQERSR